MLLRFLRLKFRKKSQRWTVFFAIAIFYCILWWAKSYHDSVVEKMRTEADHAYAFPTIYTAKRYNLRDVQKHLNASSFSSKRTKPKKTKHQRIKFNRTRQVITESNVQIVLSSGIKDDGKYYMNLNADNNKAIKTKVENTPNTYFNRSFKIPSTREIDDFLLMYKIKPNHDSNRIPTIIHQIWENETVPVIFAPWIKSWKKLKRFEYWFWTEHSIKLLIRKLYPDFIGLYNSYEDHRTGKSDKADARRYFILYTFGGYYADLDFEVLKPFRKLTDQWPCFIGEEPLEHVALYTDWTNYPTNALMGCIPQHPFFKYILANLPGYAKKAKQPDSAFMAAGPKFISHMYREFKAINHIRKHDVALAPAELFMPTFDKDIMSNLYHFCTEAKRNQFQNDICNKLKARSFENEIPSTAFLNHLWEHSYMKTYLEMINIRDVIPYVVNTSELLT